MCDAAVDDEVGRRGGLDVVEQLVVAQRVIEEPQAEDDIDVDVPVA